MNKGDNVYYTRIFPTVGLYEVCDLKVRTVEEDWFCATEKRTHKAFLFSYKDIGVTVFKDREQALELVLEAERHKKPISTEKYYEEY